MQDSEMMRNSFVQPNHRTRETIVKASCAGKIRKDNSLIAVGFLPLCEKDLRQAFQVWSHGKYVTQVEWESLLSSEFSCRSQNGLV
jgi:hypothetical protein